MLTKFIPVFFLMFAVACTNTHGNYHTGGHANASCCMKCECCKSHCKMCKGKMGGMHQMKKTSGCPACDGVGYPEKSNHHHGQRHRR